MNDSKFIPRIFLIVIINKINQKNVEFKINHSPITHEFTSKIAYFDLIISYFYCCSIEARRNIVWF